MRQIRLPLVVCFIGLTCLAALADEGSLVLPMRVGDPVQLSLGDGLDDRNFPDILQVFVGPAENCCAGKTPIAGAYHLVGANLSFDPVFDFIAGQTYTVRPRGKLADLVSFKIETARDLLTPKVVAIYPSGPILPENTLRFYVQFSTPMMPHRAGEFIRLLDAEGTADNAAFMSFTQELWNEDRTQLTLLLDPGRIKRGVAQNLTLGPALLEGRAHSITIESGWPSAIGAHEVTRFEKSFTVSGALRHLPDVDLWQIEPPMRGTQTPLVIYFDRPFDFQQVPSAILVRDSNGQPISGTVSLENHERVWRFEPDAAWSTSLIHIEIDPQLEDVAGNNFRELLDHALGTEPVAKGQETITIDVALDP